MIQETKGIAKATSWKRVQGAIIFLAPYGAFETPCFSPRTDPAPH